MKEAGKVVAKVFETVEPLAHAKDIMIIQRVHAYPLMTR